jgi:hypothetical protein
MFEVAADKALSTLPKNAPQEQIDKMLGDLSDKLLKQKYTVDPGFFSRNKEVPAIGIGDVKGARSIRIPLEQIPPTDQATISNLYKTAKVKPSTAGIERIYAIRKMQQSGQITREAMIDQIKAVLAE